MYSHLAALVVAALVLVGCGGQPAAIAPLQTPLPATTSLPTVPATLTPTTRPTAAPTATPSEVRLAFESQVFLRSGPAFAFPLLRKLDGPGEVIVTAYRFKRFERWYHVQDTIGGEAVDGWIELSSSVPEVEQRLTVDRTVYTPPPTETPQPTAVSVSLPTTELSSGGGRTGAICRDGSRSSAIGQGACSRHGGVAQWLTK